MPCSEGCIVFQEPKNARLVGQEHTALVRRLAEVQGGGLARRILILNSYFQQVLKVYKSIYFACQPCW